MRTGITMLLLAILGLGSQWATAADCTDKSACAGATACCDRCGRHAACIEKVCQVVCEKKKETKTCWQVECTDICPLMPACHHCDECCSSAPRCGNPKTVKKLVKKEYQVEVPVYKCVVRNVCSECSKGGVPAAPSEAAPPAAEPTPAKSK
jgi:hypothetical protein